MAATWPCLLSDCRLFLEKDNTSLVGDGHRAAQLVKGHPVQQTSRGVVATGAKTNAELGGIAVRRDDHRRLAEQRNHALARLRDIHLSAERGRRELTLDERAEFDRLEAEARSLTVELEAASPAPHGGNGGAVSFRPG